MNGFLDKAYTQPADGDTRQLYATWAETYEQELTQAGYATPGRIATVLAERLANRAAPILDYGCGTGLGGQALAQAGFTTIDGLDVSPEMLGVAREKSIYRNLVLADPEDGAPALPDSYAAITAIGVIGIGAAPPAVFDQIMQILPQGAICVLSINDHSLADPGYAGRIGDWLDCGAARLLAREHGPHIPARDLCATVFVLEKP